MYPLQISPTSLKLLLFWNNFFNSRSSNLRSVLSAELRSNLEHWGETPPTTWPSFHRDCSSHFASFFTGTWLLVAGGRDWRLSGGGKVWADEILRGGVLCRLHTSIWTSAKRRVRGRRAVFGIKSNCYLHVQLIRCGSLLNAAGRNSNSSTAFICWPWPSYTDSVTLTGRWGTRIQK